VTEGALDLATRAEILPLLGAVKRNGKDIQSFCPAHPDGQKHGMKAGYSLILHGSGVLKCYAGCSFKDVMAALRARGGEAPKARAAPQGRTPDSGVKWMQIVAYEYRDPATNDLLAIKGRFERPTETGSEKRFAWRLPTGTYHEGLGGLQMADMPLWGWETIEKGTKRVWVAEGEKATEAIRKVGEVAVCGGWGAHQREFGEQFEILRDRHVILWPDNDAPGREYMATVKRALRGIAKSVTTVTAPVPPKGDAVEYFAVEGQTIESLLANVLHEATVDVLGEAWLRVRLPSEQGVVAFEFAQMQHKRTELECNLTVTAPWLDEAYDQWINLKSQSTREGLRRALEAQFGKDSLNWTAAISTAYAKARATYEGIDRAVLVGAMPQLPDDLYLVETLIPYGSATVIFGKGSSGKSAIAKRIGLEVAFGGTFLGLRCKRGAVLFLDYEDPRGLQHDLRRHLDGMGIGGEILPNLPVYFWPTHGEALAVHADAIRRFCDKHEVELIVVDSAMPACGGEPERSEPALGFFNALTFIGRTALVVSHVGHTEFEAGARRPYGNIVWENAPRRVWAVHRDDNTETDAIEIMLKCTKTNKKMPRPIGARLMFSGEEDRGPIDLERGDVRQNVEFRGRLPLGEQIRAILMGGARSVSDLLDELEMDAKKGAMLRVTLSRMKDVQALSSGGCRGIESLWGLIATGEAPAGSGGGLGPCSTCGAEAEFYSNAGQPVCGEHVK